MRRPRRALAAALALAALVPALGGGASGASAQIGTLDEAGWQGVLGVRAPVSAAQRYVVLLRGPSVAARVRTGGGSATEAQLRQWTSSARGAQEQFLRRMAASGAQVAPEHRYVRVLNAFSARLDHTSLALLERDREVAGIYPVRIAYPTADDVAPVLTAAVPASVPGLGVPGLDGRGVVVALLDTGVDQSHPFLRDSLRPGLDVVTPGSGGIAQPHPRIPGRPERHGTELAGIVTGSDGPGGLHGIAPEASILPIRVAGWQPVPQQAGEPQDTYAVYSRTDQILAGLEAAVDPNGDGDTLDAARIALVGVAEPYAAFADGPLARAIEGAAALDMLVVVPAGNDGGAGPAFGSIAGPGGAPAALTVGAVDGRLASPTVRVYARAGLRGLFDGVLPLGGAPTQTVTAGVVPVPRAASARGIRGFFDERGVSGVAGEAVLLARDGLSDDVVEEAAAAGARAILVDGPLPAGAFSLDVPAGVPVVGLPTELARTIRSLLAEGEAPITVSVGAAHFVGNTGGGSVAAFSSSGLAFSSVLKPELVAPGVSVPTSEPGRSDEGEVRYGTVSGTSAAAAVAAGAAAVLAQARPGANAMGLRGLLVGSARRVEDDTAGAGTLDLQAAVQQELAVEPAAVSFGAVGGAQAVEQVVRISNLSTRRLTVTLRGATEDEVEITWGAEQLRLRAGGSTEVTVRAELGGSATSEISSGELVLTVRGSPALRVPWALSRPAADVDLLSEVSLQKTGERISDTTPAAVSFVAGAIGDDTNPEIRPLEELEVQLWRGNQLVGVLTRRRELLPGRYTFGLNGRGPDGERLPRRAYVIRLVARPGDGTRRQVESVDYVVR